MQLYLLQINLNLQIAVLRVYPKILMTQTTLSVFQKEMLVDDLDTLKKRNPDKLIFGNLNINSLSSKFDQMKVLLQGKVDILVLTESKLDDTFSFYHGGIFPSLQI